LRNALRIKDGVPYLNDLQLHKEGYKDAVAAKVSFVTALLTQFDIRLQNPAYAHLGVADYRVWKTADPTPTEIDKVVQTEKCFGPCDPCIAGASAFFGTAKKIYFAIPPAERQKMEGHQSFVDFWKSILCDQQHPRALRHYAAAILISCCSSCDAERAISVLNRIVTSLRNRMSWGNIRMHLIGAEDINASEYAYEQVAHAWGATGRRYKKHKERKTPQRKARAKRAKVLEEGGRDELGECSDFSDFSAGSSSSASSFSSISSCSSSCSSDSSE